MSRSVAAGDTYTVESGTNSYNNGIDLAGELNLAGEVFMTDTVDDRTAIGAGSASGASVSTPSRFTSAAGVGASVGTATPTPTRFTAATGTGTATATATPALTRFTAATGTGTATATAPLADRTRFSLAPGVGSGRGVVVVELSVTAGDTFTVAAGTSDSVAGINLTGEANIAGELNITEGSGRALRVRYSNALGTASGVATATPAPTRFSLATGVGSAAGVATPTPTRFTAATGTGTATATATPALTRFTAATGTGTATATATPAPTRFTTATGVGSAAGTAIKTIIYPMIRRDSATMAYDDREEFDLSGDPYDT